MTDLDRLRLVVVEPCDTCDGTGAVADADDPDMPAIGCPDCMHGERRDTIGLTELATLLDATRVPA